MSELYRHESKGLQSSGASRAFDSMAYTLLACLGASVSASERVRGTSPCFQRLGSSPGPFAAPTAAAAPWAPK